MRYRTYPLSDWQFMARAPEELDGVHVETDITFYTTTPTGNNRAFHRHLTGVLRVHKSQFFFNVGENEETYIPRSEYENFFVTDITYY